MREKVCAKICQSIKLQSINALSLALPDLFTELRLRHLLGEEIVELVRDSLAESVLILVIHALVQGGKLVVFQCLLCHHISVRRLI